MPTKLKKGSKIDSVFNFLKSLFKSWWETFRSKLGYRTVWMETFDFSEVDFISNCIWILTHNVNNQITFYLNTVAPTLQSCTRKFFLKHYFMSEVSKNCTIYFLRPLIKKKRECTCHDNELFLFWNKISSKNKNQFSKFFFYFFWVSFIGRFVGFVSLRFLKG